VSLELLQQGLPSKVACGGDRASFGIALMTNSSFLDSIHIFFSSPGFGA
jgi:hypothetical protein